MLSVRLSSIGIWENSPGHNFIVDLNNAVWIAGSGAEDDEKIEWEW